MKPGGQIRAAIRAAKTVATKVSPAFARTQLATGGTPDGGSQSSPVYYSGLQEGLANAKQQSATPQDWKNILPKLSKQDEIDTTGANDFLDQQQGQVTKQALMNHVAQNVPKINEVWKGAGVTQNKGISGIEGMRPKHSGQVLPGGTNYKEMLMTLSPKPSSDKISREQALYAGKWGQPVHTISGGKEWTFSGRGAEYDKMKALPHDAQFFRQSEGFKHSHWDEPNVLVHARMNDRRGPKGEKILHIEEIQSDWHQKGREEGYRGDKKPRFTVHAPLGDHHYDTKEEAHAARERLGAGVRISENLYPKNSSVPDAPFRDTKDWTALAMKRLIRHAADNGYHGITWTTGDQQADRYDLGKKLQGVIATKHAKGYNLRGIENDDAGTYHDFGTDIPEEKLSQHVGKDLAEKISKQNPGRHRYEGVDLKIGGEGMRGYYDGIVPSVAAKLGKEHGVKPGMIDLPDLKPRTSMMPAGPSGVSRLFDGDGNLLGESSHRDELEKKRTEMEESAKVHYMPIAPSMKGKPHKMFKNGGIVRPKIDVATKLVQKYVGQ